MVPLSPPFASSPTVWLDVGPCGGNPTGIPRLLRNLALALREAEPELGLRVEWVVPEGSRWCVLSDLPRPPAPGSVFGRLAALCGSLPMPGQARHAVVRLHRGLQVLIARRVSSAEDFRVPDLLLLPHAGDARPPVAAIRRLRGQGTIIAALCHDILPLTRPDLFDEVAEDVFRGGFLTLLPELDALVGISGATLAELVVWAMKEGRSLPSLSLAPPIIRVPPPDPAMWGRLGIAPDRTPLLVMVGAFTPRKNHLFALEVMERVWSAGGDATLLMIGPPHPLGAHDLRRLRRHPEAGRRLRLVHDATDAEVAEAYRVARALLMPSEAEGFGMPIAEALTCGCPVVCSDIPVFREIAGELAIDCPLRDTGAWADAVLEVLARPWDEAERAARARAAEERFGATALRATARMLKDLVHSSSCPPHLGLPL